MTKRGIRRRILFTFVAVVLVSLATAAPQGQTPGSRELFEILRQGKVGFIDRTGQVVIPAEFEGAEDFSDGRAAFSARVPAFPFTKYGYGLAPVGIRGRGFGFIDKSGREVIPMQFQLAGEFSDGLAWGAYDFSEGLARVSTGPLFGFIDRQGKYIWQPTE